ncbi:hypothetical protein C7974DRAFT_400324 [Boeremia exigua]|uniref:uncharacterized protein n=1 Tax=Boeremia exigua TaxID=749465 RepID=UPI001E8EEA65|nr:uncharacterized protein C7974DRAFT_400324 [Boeremia exigua]KAH6618538.1 hypothetical protein C7974DRAFT_400324 [Boeremia exigua]
MFRWGVGCASLDVLREVYFWICWICWICFVGSTSLDSLHWVRLGKWCGVLIHVGKVLAGYIVSSTVVILFYGV